MQRSFFETAAMRRFQRPPRVAAHRCRRLFEAAAVRRYHMLRGSCAQVLTEQVGRLVDGIVDGRQLCIDPGRAAWLAYLDIYVLDAGAQTVVRRQG